MVKQNWLMFSIVAAFTHFDSLSGKQAETKSNYSVSHKNIEGSYHYHGGFAVLQMWCKFNRFSILQMSNLTWT